MQTYLEQREQLGSAACSRNAHHNSRNSSHWPRPGGLGYNRDVMGMRPSWDVRRSAVPKERALVVSTSGVRNRERAWVLRTSGARNEQRGSRSMQSRRPNPPSPMLGGRTDKPMLKGCPYRTADARIGVVPGDSPPREATNDTCGVADHSH